MRPEIEAFLKSAPTYFDLRTRPSDQRLQNYQLPFSLEDLVLECAENNVAVTSPLGTNRKDILHIHQADRRHSYIDGATVIDKGPEGLELIDTDISSLHTLLTGAPRLPEEEDFANVYSRNGERVDGLLVVSLKPGVGFGEFIEQYPTHEDHLLTDDTHEHDAFAQGYDQVSLEPSFYGLLDRFLKRRELIKKHHMIDPVALFNQLTGDLILQFEGSDVYWWQFVELKNDDRSAQTIGFIRVKKEGLVG